MKLHIWPLYFVITVSLNTANPIIASNDIDGDKEHPSVARLLSALQITYEASSTENLGLFFEQWHDSVSSRITESITDPAVKDVYGIYMTFFRPLSPMAKDFNEGVKFVIVQDSIRYKVGHLPDVKEKSIHDFRPDLNLEGAKRVYLTSSYRQALLEFLGPDGPNGVPEESREEIWKRQGFLNNYVRVFPYHWWDGWNLVSQPEVTTIIFNMVRTEAIVHFSVGYEGGEATLQKENGEWVVKGHQFNWVE